MQECSGLSAGIGPPPKYFKSHLVVKEEETTIIYRTNFEGNFTNGKH